MKKLVLVIVFLLCSSTVTHAFPLIFAYEGIVNNTQGGAAFDAFLGATLRIDYAVDAGTVDSNSSPDIGTYSLDSLIFTLGSNIYVGDNRSQIDISIAGREKYDVETFSFGLSGPSIGGITPNLGILRLWNNGTSIFPDDSLPLISPNPQLLGDALLNPNHSILQLQFHNIDNSGDGIISVDGNGNITNLSANPIPEPTTIALLSIGLTGLAGSEVRRRRKKKARRKRAWGQT